MKYTPKQSAVMNASKVIKHINILSVSKPTKTKPRTYMTACHLHNGVTMTRHIPETVLNMVRTHNPEIEVRGYVT